MNSLWIAVRTCGQLCTSIGAARGCPPNEARFPFLPNPGLASRAIICRPSGLAPFSLLTHGLRHGLYSAAALRLAWGAGGCALLPTACKPCFGCAGNGAYTFLTSGGRFVRTAGSLRQALAVLAVVRGCEGLDKVQGEVVIYRSAKALRHPKAFADAGVKSPLFACGVGFSARLNVVPFPVMPSPEASTRRTRNQRQDQGQRQRQRTGVSAPHGQRQKQAGGSPASTHDNPRVERSYTRGGWH